MKNDMIDEFMHTLDTEWCREDLEFIFEQMLGVDPTEENMMKIVNLYGSWRDLKDVIIEDIYERLSYAVQFGLKGR